mgnify:CR=1 FL=1
MTDITVMPTMPTRRTGRPKTTTYTPFLDGQIRRFVCGTPEEAARLMRRMRQWMYRHGHTATIVRDEQSHIVWLQVTHVAPK